jgi:enterochelin esterase-like enzyme
MLRKLLFASMTMFALCVGFVQAKDDYKLGDESMVHENVPHGDIIAYPGWKSEVFPGTVRNFWVYVPKQYDSKEPTCFMVFQDGEGYKNPNGSYRVPVVFDNLIHKKEIPVMIGIFINPGKDRSFEYDSLTPQYVTFLEKEILPEVSKKFNLRTDAAGRGIGGASSGGICAFTAAWERPDMFSKVLSHIGSFANIRGGDRYPGIIRKTKNKDIRVFLQDGSNDLNNEHGDWWLSNLQMESALKKMKYDYKVAWGDGGHSGKHGGAILPDSLRWLWRDTPPAAKK